MFRSYDVTMSRMDRRTRKSAETIGRNLAAWRKMLNLTSQQVAERAGISRTTLSSLENGKPVGNDTFVSVARALGILDRIVDATDPWQSDLGRMRANDDLPKRVRHRD